MTQQQAQSLKKLLPFAAIVDDNASLDDMMRQAAMQSHCHVDCMTMQRLDMLLSEGMSVIMWGGYLGEELRASRIEHRGGGYRTSNCEFGTCYFDLSIFYHGFFDLLDRHENESSSGVIVDTLVAPYLALVIPK